MEFKNRLYELRMQKGLSQAELAKAIGVSAGTIGMYESGSRMPSRLTQEKLADYFNVTLDYLMGKEIGSIYYLNPETAKIAQQIYEDPDLHALFDAAEDANPKDMKMAAELLRRLKKTNPDG